MPNERKTITKADLTRTPPRERTDIMDTTAKGLVLRLTPQGGRSFAFYYWDRQLKKTCWVTFDGVSSLDEARTKANRLSADARNGASLTQDAKVTKVTKQLATGVTFDELVIKYLAHIKEEVPQPGGVMGPRRKSWRNVEVLMKRPSKAWGKLLASSVTDDMVAVLLDKAANETHVYRGVKAKKLVTANRLQSELHTLFDWARQPGRKFVPFNPCAGLERKGGREIGRERVLDAQEIKTLWWGIDDPATECPRHIGLAYRLILTTMLRPGEVAEARRDEIDLSKNVWEVPASRTKKKRPISQPLGSLAREAIGELLANGKHAFLFPGRAGRDAPINPASLPHHISGANNIVGICKKLGMKPFTPHDLRRTAATLANSVGAEQGVMNVDLYVKKTLDHLDASTVTARYNRHQYLPQKRQVLDMLDAELRRIIGKPPRKLKLVA